MKILVTGATGFLGNNLARKLLELGHQVIATVRPTSDLRPLDGMDVETVLANLVDPAAISPIVQDVDLIIHCAAMIQIGHTKRESSIAFNADSTTILAQAARRRGIRMIHVLSLIHI